MKLGISLNLSEKLKVSHELAYALGVSLIAEWLFHGLVETSEISALAGRIVAMFCSLYVIGLIGTAFESYGSSYRGSRDVLAGLIITSFFLVVGWFGTIVSFSLAEYVIKHRLYQAISTSSLHFIIPYAAGGLILQAILGLRYAFVYSAAVGLVTFLYGDGDITLAIYFLISSLAASLSLVRIRSRLVFMRAGLYISLLSLIFATVSIFLNPEVKIDELPIRYISGIFGALFAALLAVGLLPLVEHLGGFVTDMRLMEIATLDHPLLKELSIQAPGTWNHSNIMGMMAETAADSVGANAWLARVGAYFHDVGKMRKPLYFVENQVSGENRHDKLSPSMSALIIRSHVKDGLELARKHNLPRVIMDMIEQHHGTSPIEYFYDKALKEAQAEGKDVDKAHYCYPGPRPQTREAGILMLADCIEAASRTMSEPTSDRIQGMVQKMINKVFASGQLNECELTLADLHKIAKCFCRVLSGIHHHRISYAEPAEKVKSKVDESVDAPRASSQGENPVEGSSSDKKRSASDDLRRLGIEE